MVQQLAKCHYPNNYKKWTTERIKAEIHQWGFGSSLNSTMTKKDDLIALLKERMESTKNFLAKETNVSDFGKSDVNKVERMLDCQFSSDCCTYNLIDNQVYEWYGQTPLLAAVGFFSHEARPKLVKALLKLKADVNMPDLIGNTPLGVALRDNNQAMIKLLTDSGANASQEAKNYLEGYQGGLRKRTFDEMIDESNQSYYQRNLL